MTERPIEPLAVSQAVEMFANDEQAAAAKFSNKAVLDESGIYDLHTLAAKIYAMGFNEGRGVEDSQARERRYRKAEAADATEEARS